jgi:hypothetical protein
LEQGDTIQTLGSLEGNPTTLLYFVFSDMKTSKENKDIEDGDGYGGDAVFFAFKGLLISGAVSFVKVANGCSINGAFTALT